MKIRILLVVSALVLLGVLFQARNYDQKISYLSGDEPHYMLMAQSLVEDGDFNLKDDHENEEWKAFYSAATLEPHISPVIDSSSSAWYSIHTIGVPLIIALPYYLFGPVGARLWVALLELSILVVFYLILKKYIKTKKRVWLGTALLAVCPLFWQNLGSLFPDMILVLCASLLVLLFARKDIRSNVAIMLVFFLGALAHSKGLVFMAPIVLSHIAWLVRVGGIYEYIKKYWLSILLIIISAAWYVYFLYSNYGIFSPSGLYGNNGQLFTANPIYNAIAVLTDRSKGLVVHFPLLLLTGPYILHALIDIASLFKRMVSRNLKAEQTHFLLTGYIMATVLLLITLLGFFDWSGSTAPNGRSMLPIILTVIFIVAKYVNFKNYLELVLLTGAVLVCLLLSWLSIAHFQYYMSAGTNSFWVDEFSALKRLPLFNLSSTELGAMPAIKGAKILAAVLLLNGILSVLHFFRIILRPRRFPD